MKQSYVAKRSISSEDVIITVIEGAGIAQFAERPTERPGAILTRVRVPGAAGDFLPE